MASEIEVVKSASQSADVKLFLAVDTGGTKTSACLVDFSESKGSRVIGRGRSSAGNPFSVGFAEATRAINSAIEQARDESPQAGGRIARLMLSIAGAANKQMSEQFVRWARETKQAEQIAIVSDALPILAGGTPNCCGIAIIAGTGSSAFGRTADGRMKRCGGWGYLLGDEGSGYSIGRSALSHALRDLESDTVWRPDSLTEAVVRMLGVKSVMDLTKAVYTSGDPRSFIAALARVVVAEGEKGEAKAEAILDGAATELAELVARTVDVLELNRASVPLAIGGGLLVSSKRLRDQLREWLRRFKLTCEATVVTEPLDGCIRLADSQFADSLVTWH